MLRKHAGQSDEKPDIKSHIRRSKLLTVETIVKIAKIANYYKQTRNIATNYHRQVPTKIGLGKRERRSGKNL